MSQTILSTCLRGFCLAICCHFGLDAAAQSQGVQITEVEYEQRPHFKIVTDAGVWFYDRRGGGFSRLIDPAGQDWIAFKKAPLSEFPASAAAGYRGLPNCVFTGPDKGAGHPGFDQCRSDLLSDSRIRTQSQSGKWEWVWEFTAKAATFRMERTDPEQPWWFLYEGPIAGSYAPGDKLWGTDAHPVGNETPDQADKLFGQWQSVALTDRHSSWALVIHQHQADALADTLWYLGNAAGGRLESPDGMIVLGFGRGPGTKPLFRGSGVRFTVGLLPLVEPGKLSVQPLVRELMRTRAAE